MEQTVSTGQKTESWVDFWKGLTPESEIRMWDFYGARQWIMKYTPRFGRTVEAGCGLGRYNFLFERLGVEMEGVDFEPNTIDMLNDWQSKNGFNVAFTVGDVTAMPHATDSLAGYISLGVVEHFIEGPHRPLNEAFRILRPGGVAIITVPSPSPIVRKRKQSLKLRTTIKKLLMMKVKERPFFQYEYTHSQLADFVRKAGFEVSIHGGCDLVFPFFQKHNGDVKAMENDKAMWDFVNKNENTPLADRDGAQSIAIGIKVAPLMHCFLSGELTATPESLTKFTVPISKEMENHPSAALYRKGVVPHVQLPYAVNPPILQPEERTCHYTGEKFMTDPLFEDFGFSVPISPAALRKPEVNMDAVCNHMRPIWRPRLGGGKVTL